MQGDPLRQGGFRLEGRDWEIRRLGQGSRWEKMRPKLWGCEDGEEETEQRGGEGRRDGAESGCAVGDEGGQVPGVWPGD